MNSAPRVPLRAGKAATTAAFRVMQFPIPAQDQPDTVSARSIPRDNRTRRFAFEPEAPEDRGARCRSQSAVRASGLQYSGNRTQQGATVPRCRDAVTRLAATGRPSGRGNRRTPMKRSPERLAGCGRRRSATRITGYGPFGGRARLLPLPVRCCRGIAVPRSTTKSIGSGTEYSRHRPAHANVRGAAHPKGYVMAPGCCGQKKFEADR